MPLYEVYQEDNFGHAPKIVATVNADNKDDAKDRAIELIKVRKGYSDEIIKRLYPKNTLRVYPV